MRALRIGIYALVGLAAVGGGALVYFAQGTRGEIDALEARVLERAGPLLDGAPAAVEVPLPVRRYFEFIFPDGVPASITASDIAWAEIEMSGDFRRPLTEGFAPTTARQVIDTRKPNLVFSADTPIAGPLWAIAHDAYIDGEMEMQARLLSAITVMEQSSTPALDRTSLRRWLLESPTFPTALLPGGPVSWEPIDATHARAVASAWDEQVALVATFRADGSLERFDAEEDGDLTTPYHGSGEHVSRGDYRLVEGMRIPMAFTIARAAGGAIHPFWRGRITSIRFGRQP